MDDAAVSGKAVTCSPSSQLYLFQHTPGPAQVAPLSPVNDDVWKVPSQRSAAGGAPSGVICLLCHIRLSVTMQCEFCA